MFKKLIIIIIIITIITMINPALKYLFLYFHFNSF